jgi:serine phosphatase RsbU (regulator of sigma subunit)
VKGRTVVLIEDDAGDAFLVTEMLSDAVGDVQVLVFTTLQQALDQWPSRCDCVLLDLGLPDAYGLSALERLHAEVPDVPVVVLTGRVDAADGPQALAAGAQDFLVKGQVDGHGLERSLRYAVERSLARVNERELLAAEVRAEENARLERGLLPSPLLDLEAVRVGTFYRPGRERALLGGDFYDAVQTGTAIHLLIGDVSGHGPDEAALGVALRIAWRSLVLAGLPQQEVLRGVERVLLAERGDEELFATVAMVSLDLELSRAEVLLCGHPAPLLVRGGQVSEVEAVAHPFLALVGATELTPTTVELTGDWALLLFTDGIFEGCREPGSADRFGVPALAEHLRGLLAGQTPRAELAPALLAEAERRHGGLLTDDVAVLLVAGADWWG